MGRHRKENIWNFFVKGPLRDNNKHSVQCKFCSYQSKAANVTRMTDHLKKCVKCPSDVRQSAVLSINSAEERDPLRDLSNQIMDVSQLDDNPSTSQSQIASTSTATPVYLFNPVQEKDKVNLDAHLAKAIFVSGAPLSMVEHPLWINFFNHLQPAYKLPSRKNLSTKLLDEAYNETKREVTKEINEATNLHLQCDGWSNIRNESIMNFLVCTPDPIFVKFVDTEDNRHTAEYISEEIIKILKEYGEEKFFVIVGDNARNIQAAFRKVVTVYPHLVPLGCVSHSLNLLCNDFLKCDSIKNIVDEVVEIIKAIKSSYLLTAQLNTEIKTKNVGQQLQLPCRTRWGSYSKSLESFQNTKVPLQSLAVNENSSFSAEIKRKLLDDTFWILVSDAVSLFKPITNWIFSLETNKCSINKVWKAYSNIESSITRLLPNIGLVNETEKGTVLYRLLERKSESIKPIHLAAYLLDPTSHGFGLDENEDVTAMEFIDRVGQTYNLDILPHLANYRSKEGSLFEKSFIWETVQKLEPVSWWKGVCKSSPLSVVAVKILTAPTTSAATERSFSVFGAIHSKTRNRLTSTRAGKISYLKYNWNLKHPEKFSNQESSDYSEDMDFSTESNSESQQPTTVNQDDYNRIIRVHSDDSDSESD